MPRQSWRKGTQCADNQNFVRKLNFYEKSAKKWIWIFCSQKHPSFRIMKFSRQKMKEKWGSEWMTRKKVVNDDLFKRKFVVVNFWCFLQSWCIRLEKTSSSWREFLEMPVNLKNIVKKADMAIFCCVNIGKPKKRFVFIVVNFAFSTIDCKNAFSLHWSSKLFVQYWNWYQKMQKKVSDI